MPDPKRDALRELSRQYRGSRLPKEKRPSLTIVIGAAEPDEDDEDTVDLGTAEPMVLEDDDEDD